MKAHKHGDKYRITYRCPNYPNIINETFDSEEEANLRIAQIMLEKKRGTLLPPAHLVDPDANPTLARETMTVEQLMSEYVSLYGLNKWSESTLSCNLHRIEHYILPYIGQIPIKTLTTHRLELFYQKLLTEPAVKTKGHEHQDKTISHSVVEKVHSLIRSALNQAIRWDYLRGANPAMTVELPKYKKAKREAWTEQEAYQALTLCTDPILKLCLYLALGCSMRIGEILGLTWDCVHIEEELIEKDEAHLCVEKELRRCKKSSLEKLKEKGRDEVFLTFPELKKTGCSTSLVLKTPKTESSMRTLYLPTTVAEAMKAMFTYQLGLKGDVYSEYTDYNLVIAQDNGRPYEERMIAEKLGNLINVYHLRPVVFHSLRHSSTGLKLKISGGDIKAVQGDTGHAVADMVTNVYSHIVDEDRKTLAKKVDEQFFSQPQPKNEEKAPAKPLMDESMVQLMQLLQSAPNLAGSLLQMSKILVSQVS
jgi:integrase